MHDGAFSLHCQHLNQTSNEQWIGCGDPVNWGAWLPRLKFQFLAVGTPKEFGVFSANQWLRGVAATGKECLSEDSSETRTFSQSVHLCPTKSWKLYRNAWDPHRASAVGIIWTLPYLSRHWCLDICWLGLFITFCILYIGLYWCHDRGNLLPVHHCYKKSTYISCMSYFKTLWDNKRSNWR